MNDKHAKKLRKLARTISQLPTAYHDATNTVPQLKNEGGKITVHNVTLQGTRTLIEGTQRAVYRELKKAFRRDQLAKK